MLTKRIALVGNPNSGKTTLFNALTGEAQYVGNRPGVTVEKKEARLKTDRSVVLCDLPGVYSLSPYSPEELVTRDYLVSDKPDAIINLVDGTNIERNLYLTTQCIEAGIPLAAALNMMDIVRKSGDTVDSALLSAELGCPVVEISALRGEGLDALARVACEVSQAGRAKYCIFGASTERALAVITREIKGLVPDNLLRWYAIKLFERDSAAPVPDGLTSDARGRIESVICAAEREAEDDAESIIAGERYEYVTALTRRCVVKSGARSLSDRVDGVVTGRVFALPIFAAVMFGVYFVSISTVGRAASELMESLFAWLGSSADIWLVSVTAPDWLRGLACDGILGGVGSVLGFVPQLLVLFFLLAVLEDVGYMARVAFIMDRAFRRLGLSGKSVIPLLVSSGCGVPGIMATRTIESERDRRITAITTTFVPCGAKLPVVALVAGSFAGGAWWLAPVMYLTGIAMVAVSGVIMKKTRRFAGEGSPFVMELPPYHMPDAGVILKQVLDRGRSFVARAGTVILAMCAALWFLQNFGISDGALRMVPTERSLLAAVGGALAPAFAPLGFGRWEAAVAALTGLVAKEQIVGTLGVLAGEAGAAALFASPLAGVSFVVFNLICVPCAAAVGALRRELGGKLAAFGVLYQTAAAYLLSLMVYQFGSAAAGGELGAGFVAALTAAGLTMFLLLRKPSSSS